VPAKLASLVAAEIGVEGSEHLVEPLWARDLGPEGQEVGEASEVAGGEDVVEATALEEVSEALEEALPARRGPVEERRGRGGRDVGRWLGLALPGVGFGNVHHAQCPAFASLHPRKRRNTERGPEAGVRGASPGVWVRRTGGGM